MAVSIAIPNGRRTLAEELRLQLADEIVRGELMPGAPLDEMELARRFRVSRTPVREAIRQLSASGLIEALCAGFAAERMTGAERRTLESAHEEMRALIHVGDPQRFHEVNEAFHNAIYAGAHNTYLAEMTFATRARVQPFRRAQFRTLGRLAQSQVEHERVVIAIQRGERERAAGAMRAHIVTVRESYEAYAESI
jgi:DNA-binding GntR family transcriptional regulator